MIIQPAKRTECVKEYYFSVKNKEMAKLNAERLARGEDRIINLGIGAPDGMPPLSAITTLATEAAKSGVHAYQSYTGIPELREALARWYKRYYGVTLDPATEIQPLVGSKEGILILSLTFLNPGDKVLVPDPGYPTYTSSTLLAGAELVPYRLCPEKKWQPDFEELEKMDLEGVKMMWTNYPNMPTGAPASEELYQRIVDFARKHRILVVNDNPYSFVLNDRPLSIFGAEGARECCLELNSLSKAHNMSGWRVGMVAGDADMIREILKVKSQMDSGMFRPLQLAAVSALDEGEDWFRALNAEYRRRKEVVWKIFDRIGATYDRDSQGLFVWGRLPEKIIEEAAGTGRTPGEILSDRLLYGCGVFITPGFVFGRSCGDYIRSSLCNPVDKLESAYSKVCGIL